MRFDLSIECEGAAFFDEDGERVDPLTLRLEIERISAKAAARIADGERSGSLMDSNGNTCGEWTLS